MPWIVTFRALHQDRRAALNVSRTESPLRCNSASKSADGFLFITHLFTCCVIMSLASVTGHTNASCAVWKSPEETTDNSCFSLLIDVRQLLRFFFFKYLSSKLWSEPVQVRRRWRHLALIWNIYFLSKHSKVFLQSCFSLFIFRSMKTKESTNYVRMVPVFIISVQDCVYGIKNASTIPRPIEKFVR